MVNCAKSSYYQQKLQTADIKETFRLVNGLLGADQPVNLPSADSTQELADQFVLYLQDKVLEIRRSLDCTVSPSQVSHIEVSASTTPPQLREFQLQSCESIQTTLKNCAPKSCSLDAIPTSLLKDAGVLAAVLDAISTSPLKDAGY